MLLTCDLSNLPLKTRERIDAMLKNEKFAEHKRAVARQKRLAKHYRDHAPQAINGLGEQTLALDPTWWRYYMRQNRIAPGEDTELRDWLKKRRAEWCAVKSTPTKLQVGYGSTRAADMPLRPQTRGALKFTKSYGDGARPVAHPAAPTPNPQS